MILFHEHGTRNLVLIKSELFFFVLMINLRMWFFIRNGKSWKLKIYLGAMKRRSRPRTQVWSIDTIFTGKYYLHFQKRYLFLPDLQFNRYFLICSELLFKQSIQKINQHSVNHNFNQPQCLYAIHQWFTNWVDTIWEKIKLKLLWLNINNRFMFEIF